MNTIVIDGVEYVVFPDETNSCYSPKLGKYGCCYFIGTSTCRETGRDSLCDPERRGAAAPVVFLTHEKYQQGLLHRLTS